jgi:ankyrin repeat protein
MRYLVASVEAEEKNADPEVTIQINYHDALIAYLKNANSFSNSRINKKDSVLDKIYNYIKYKYLADSSEATKMYLGYTMLYWAAACNQIKEIKKIIDGYHLLGKDKIDQNIINNVLLISAANGHIKIIKILLEHGADINYSQEDGANALFFAVQNGHVDLVSWLLDNGVSIEIANSKNGRSPLDIAASHSTRNMVELLLKRGANIHTRFIGTADTPLLSAARGSKLDTVKCLLENKANIHDRSSVGSSSLHYAAANDCHELSKILLANGADTEAMDKSGYTTLSTAASYGHYKTAKLLLKNKANPDSPSFSTATALYLVAESGHGKVVDILLSSKANPELVVSSTKSELSKDVADSSPEIIQRMQTYLQTFPTEWVTVSPSKIAEIMGHADIAARIKTYEDNGYEPDVKRFKA